MSTIRFLEKTKIYGKNQKDLKSGIRDMLSKLHRNFTLFQVTVLEIELIFPTLKPGNVLLSCLKSFHSRNILRK